MEVATRWGMGGTICFNLDSIFQLVLLPPDKVHVKLFSLWLPIRTLYLRFFVALFFLAETKIGP